MLQPGDILGTVYIEKAYLEVREGRLFLYHLAPSPKLIEGIKYNKERLIDYVQRVGGRYPQILQHKEKVKQAKP